MVKNKSLWIRLRNKTLHKLIFYSLIHNKRRLEVHRIRALKAVMSLEELTQKLVKILIKQHQKEIKLYLKVAKQLLKEKIQQ